MQGDRGQLGQGVQIGQVVAHVAPGQESQAWQSKVGERLGSGC